ncbi:MAG TPA: hypothetical protein VJ735_15210 [Actinomycetes bacterium]|nr:hypothetical protein [Actinomycetes bacterium]
MEIRRSPALAGMVRELYQAMGSGDADAVEGFYAVLGVGGQPGDPGGAAGLRVR